jgi:hypothetical protein
MCLPFENSFLFFQGHEKNAIDNYSGCCLMRSQIIGSICTWDQINPS